MPHTPLLLACCLFLASAGCRSLCPFLPAAGRTAGPPTAARGSEAFSATPAQAISDAAEKVTRLRAYMAREGFDAAVLGTPASLHWVTAGATQAVGPPLVLLPWRVVVTATAKHLVAPTRAVDVLLAKALAGQGYEAAPYPWHAGQSAALAPLLRDKRVASDVPLDCCPSAKVVRGYAELYWPLTELERRRYRWLGARVAEALAAVAYEMEAETRDVDVTVLLRRELAYWQVRVVRCTVTAAGSAAGRRAACVRLVATRWGLVVSTARVVAFGHDRQLEAAFRKAAVVAARIQAACQPGERLGAVSAVARRAYAEAGMRDVWAYREPGGAVAYEERTAVATPEQPLAIRAGMSLVWRVAAGGAWIEDTFLVAEEGLEVLTSCRRWPAIEVRVGGTRVRVPSVLVR